MIKKPTVLSQVKLYSGLEGAIVVVIFKKLEMWLLIINFL